MIDLDHESVRQDGRLVPLHDRERRILSILVANHGRVVSREAMLLLTRGADPTVDVRTRALDVHIRSIRAKLGQPGYLQTVEGVGYGVALPPAQVPDAPVDVELVRQRLRDRSRSWAR